MNGEYGKNETFHVIVVLDTKVKRIQFQKSFCEMITVSSILQLLL